MNNNFNIIYTKNCQPEINSVYKIIQCFTSYCVDELNIKSNFNIFLINTNKDPKTNMSLAAFDMDTKDVWCKFDNRHVMDINRSIAHELVHLSQLENNEIDLNTYTDIGGKIEDDANAIAGQLCKKFIKTFNCKWLYAL